MTDDVGTGVDENLTIREAANCHCRRLGLQWGDAVPWPELARGFPYGDSGIKLLGVQGVFRPKKLTDGPLTLLSTMASSYEDEHLEGDEMLYDYAPPGRDYENDGLKRVAALGRSVIS
jgi:putative restriction endonuclease